MKPYVVFDFVHSDLLAHVLALEIFCKFFLLHLKSDWTFLEYCIIPMGLLTIFCRLLACCVFSILFGGWRLKAFPIRMRWGCSQGKAGRLFLSGEM